jgi:C1q-related factor
MKALWSAFALLTMVSFGTAQARDARQEEKESTLIANYRSVDPASSLVTNGGHCPATGIVAFSATGINHVSAGSLTLLGYSTTYTNEGGGWIQGGGTFIAPCTGLYSFTISFTKDAFAYGGTMGDVAVYIAQNGCNKGYAFSGHGSGQRGTGSYTVVLYLEGGDYVQSFVGSGNEAKRHLVVHNFTGHLVKMLE